MPIRNSIDSTITANGVQVANTTGTGIGSTVLSDGQVLLGSTGAAPIAGTISVSNGLSSNVAAGSFSIAGTAATDAAVGVVELATSTETTTGTDTTRAVVPSGLAAKLGAQTANAIPYGGGSTAALNWAGPLTNGQLLVGSTGNAPVATTLTAGTGIQISNNSGAITITNNGGTGSFFTKFTSSGSWSKQASTKWVIIYCWGGGGGGGSGRRGAAAAARTGGSGGGGGPFFWWQGPAEVFDTTETITVGAGGTGGAAQTVDLQNGNPGGGFTDSSVGDLSTNDFSAASGAGLGGTAANVTGGGHGGYWNPAGGQAITSVAGGSVTTGTATAVANIPNTAYSTVTFVINQAGLTGGGGGGGSLTTANARGNGAVGQNIVAPGPRSSANIVSAGGTAGVAAGPIDGGAGATYPSTGGYFAGGAGGGGGAAGDPVGGVGGNGGAGGIPGGGGGGGGASLNGFNSGAGGDGGRGEIWILEIA